MSGAPTVRHLPADRFHAGVRMATLAAWFGAIVLVYAVLAVIVSAIIAPATGAGAALLAVIALFLAQPLAFLVEKQIVARWPSGRHVRLEPGALLWTDKSISVRLDVAQKVNYWRWRFAVKRRRGGRVPVGHHCFAIRLVQSDTLVTLYEIGRAHV